MSLFPMARPSAPQDLSGSARRILPDERGVVSIEFALVTPILMLIILAMVDFGLAFREKMEAETAARAGLQYAIYDRSDQAGITGAITAATQLPAADLTIDVTTFYECADGSHPSGPAFCGAGDWPGTYVRVTVTKTFNALFTYAGLADTFTVTGSAEGRVQ